MPNNCTTKQFLHLKWYIPRQQEYGGETLNEKNRET